MDIETVAEEWRNLRDGKAFDREAVEDALAHGGKRVRDLLLLLTIDPHDYTSDDIDLMVNHADREEAGVFTREAFRRAASDPRGLDEALPALLEEMGERLRVSTPFILLAYVEWWHGFMWEALHHAERARDIDRSDTLASQVIFLSRSGIPSREFAKA